MPKTSHTKVTDSNRCTGETNKMRNEYIPQECIYIVYHKNVFIRKDVARCCTRQLHPPLPTPRPHPQPSPPPPTPHPPKKIQYQNQSHLVPHPVPINVWRYIILSFWAIDNFAFRNGSSEWKVLTLFCPKFLLVNYTISFVQRNHNHFLSNQLHLLSMTQKQTTLQYRVHRHMA